MESLFLWVLEVVMDVIVLDSRFSQHVIFTRLTKKVLFFWSRIAMKTNLVLAIGLSAKSSRILSINKTRKIMPDTAYLCEIFCLSFTHLSEPALFSKPPVA
jgi:hypothetical protein